MLICFSLQWLSAVLPMFLGGCLSFLGNILCLTDFILGVLARVIEYNYSRRTFLAISLKYKKHQIVLRLNAIHMLIV